MAERPHKEFGARKPVAIQPAQPVKRGQVALLLMGTFAIGGGAYALMPGANCETRPGMAAPSGQIECQPRGSSSSSSHGGSSGSSGWSSRNSFYGDSSSTHTSSGTSSDSGSGPVTRGGFGGFAHSFGSHFSGGG
jgi:hypothetical protein